MGTEKLTQTHQQDFEAKSQLISSDSRAQEQKCWEFPQTERSTEGKVERAELGMLLENASGHA